MLRRPWSIQILIKIYSIDAFSYENEKSIKKSVALPREPKYFKLKLTTMQVRKSVTVMQHCFKTNY